MTLTYSLNQDDYLNHQLFTASLSDRIKKQRRRNWIIWSLAFLGLAWLFFQEDDSFLAYYFFIFAILYFFFYPYLSRWYYKRHYKKFINETYKNRFDKVSNVTIDNNQILDINESSETKIAITEVDKIYELPEYFFVKFKSGVTLIVPKLKIDNINLLKTELKRIAENQHVDFIEMQTWKWK